ncbi:hypothetical protein PM082_004141 [Marasmius tenuissimus]|nr:hypothetical protein PM082_004141 [Marasmius tenuissimus]
MPPPSRKFRTSCSLHGRSGTRKTATAGWVDPISLKGMQTEGFDSNEQDIAQETGWGAADDKKSPSS